MRRSAAAHRKLAKAATTALASATCFLGILAFPGCHKFDEPPFNPRELGRNTRLASRERIIKDKEPVPTTKESRPSTRPDVRASASKGATEEVVVRLGLQEVIQRAVAHNSDVAVAGYEPAIEETRVIEAEARFDPAFFSNLTFTDEEVLSPSSSNVLLDPFNPSGFQSLSFQNGIRQNLYSGGTAEFSYRTQRIYRDQIPVNEITGDRADVGVNPYYLNELLLRVTQPLLRDFGAEINRARITIARNNQRISVLEFRATLEEQIFITEQVYWQLVQAGRDVLIQEDLLAETIRTADILEARRRAGADVTRVQTSQAESAVASREAVLVRARSRVKDLSDELKRRMGDPAYPSAGAVLILPADMPLTAPLVFDPAEQFDLALKTRLELGQQQIRIDSAGIALDVAKNNILPQLNLVGQVAFQGAGDGFSEAFYEGFEFHEPSYSAGLEFEIPFGNRLARAVLKRAELQRGQAMAQYIGLIKTIEQEVSTSLREVDTTYDEIVSRARAVFEANDSLRAIQQRREADEALTPTFVQLELDSQQTLANARLEESQAISAYNTAIARLERSKGTLLRYNNIVMQERQLQK